MPEIRKDRHIVLYRGSVPKEWMPAIEEYREQHGLSETELIRAALQSLIGKRKLSSKHIPSIGRPSGEAWHGTST